MKKLVLSSFAPVLALSILSGANAFAMGKSHREIASNQPAPQSPPASFDFLDLGDVAVFKTSGHTAGMPTHDDNCHISEEITGYEKSTDTYTQTASIRCPNGSTSSEQTVTGANALTPKRIDDILANCEKDGGKLEQVVVPAGTFDTCRLPVNDAASGAQGQRWVGRVPLGNVKVASSVGSSFFNLELTSYSWAKPAQEPQPQPSQETQQ